MSTALQSAHRAYAAAAELGPAPTRNVDVVVDWRRVSAAMNEEIEISRPMIAFAGGVMSLILGVICGAWLQL